MDVCMSLHVTHKSPLKIANRIVGIKWTRSGFSLPSSPVERILKHHNVRHSTPENRAAATNEHPENVVHECRLYAKAMRTESGCWLMLNFVYLLLFAISII